MHCASDIVHSSTEKNSSHSPAFSEKRLMFSCEINFYKNCKILFTSRLFFVKLNVKTKQTQKITRREEKECILTSDTYIAQNNLFSCGEING